jgi:RNA polymerase sigma-54 factor
MSPTDNEIALALIDGLSDDGYLSVSLEDILESLDESLEVEEDEVVAVLHRLQQFEPTGVFAQDLQDCLLLQLKQLPENTLWLTEAKVVIGQHIALLGSKDYAQVMRKTKLSEDNLKEVLRLIQALTPRPGELIVSEQSEYVIPDVIVRKVKEGWRVELNPEIAPKLRVNSDYASLVKRADNSPDNAYLKDNLQEARWFIKSLLSRNDTLLKVATKIVEFQEEFFEIGDEGMKPLVLHDIAEAVEMHESTISRVTTQKFMHTPRGIFELKYFFSSHVSTDSGGECSSTAIRAMIRKLIAEESLKKPLSDNKIATILGEKGIQVARRTVAKYREAMMIPPSNERKRLL